MNRRIFAALLLAMIAAAVAVRLSAPPPDRRPPPPAPEKADLPEPGAEPIPPKVPIPPSAAPSPERLRPYLEALGRAGLLRDVRRLAEFRRSTPEIFETDLPWLFGRLRDELFLASGAADLLASFRP